MEFVKMTRAQAERVVARTVDLPALRGLAQHKNKHVQAKAKFKLERLEKAER
jgi:hypothetical protein